MPPRVSICIPAYNQPDYVRRAIESILIQTFNDYEVVITDDSSSDTVEKVVNEIARGDKRVVYHRNSPAKGSPENWNEAVRRASGDYIKMLHHDDWFSDGSSLAQFVGMLDAYPSANFAFCASWKVDRTGVTVGINRPAPYQLRRLARDPCSLYSGNFVGAPSATIFRRKASSEFDRKLKWLVDVDSYISILRKNGCFVFATKPLVCVTSGAEHQVTNVCEGNRCLELFEYLHLYKKLSGRVIVRARHLPVLLALFRKHKVVDRKAFDECGCGKLVSREVLIVGSAYFLFERAMKITGLWSVLRAARRRLREKGI